jgi:SAM-dependent methyltransferase
MRIWILPLLLAAAVVPPQQAPAPNPQAPPAHPQAQIPHDAQGPAGEKARDRVEAPNAEYNTPEGRAKMVERLSNAEREKSINPEGLVRALGIKPGDRVADIGTGTGLLLPYVSRAVGPTGTVYAEDIFPDFLQKARQRAMERGLENVVFVLGGERHPGLPSGQLDFAIMLDSYHHFEYPRVMLDGIRAALKPEGRIVIVDYYKRGGMATHMRIDRDAVVKEVESFGWKLEASPQVTENQYVLIFRRPPS